MSVVLSEAKDLIAACNRHEILRFAQDDKVKPSRNGSASSKRKRASPGAADPDVTRLPYTKRKTPFWPKVADPWGPSS